ncbi:MAG: radical SAM protein [Chitinispirillaceae bacterium]|nr:radical SAM protein [Chitinispirillaceae bacterium]
MMLSERDTVPASGTAGAVPEVLFVHVPKRSGWYKPLDEMMSINYIPMGVFGLCDLVNKNGITAKIRHLGLELILGTGFSVVEYVRTNHIRVVAISLHWHYQAYDVIETARRIKSASPETVIVLGGFTASIFSREILVSYEWVDCIIAGDGERGMVELARVVCRDRGGYDAVANCVFRKNGEIIDNGISSLTDVNALADIDFANLSYLEHYTEYRDYFKLPMLWSINATVKENRRRQVGGAASVFPLMTGRGCNFDCSFCGGGARAQKKICNREKAAFLPVAKVADTIEQAVGFGYESFLVCFDPDPSDSGYYRELFGEIRRRGIRCGMGFESWGLPDDPFIAAFAETFIREKSYIALSPESASEEIRQRNKGYFYTNDELFAVMELTAEFRIPVLIYLTTGLPGEMRKHLEMNRIFARRLRRNYAHLVSVIMVPVQLEPPSPMYETPEEFNITTFRKRFADFYEHHRRTDSNPFTHLGYLSHAYRDINGDTAAFDALVKDERCRNYCSIPVKLFGRWNIPWLSRLLCTMMHRRWLRKGFGRPTMERQTFR